MKNARARTAARAEIIVSHKMCRFVTFLLVSLCKLSSFMFLGFVFFFFRNWKVKASYVRLNIISWKQGTGKRQLTCTEIKTCGRKHTGSVLA